MALLAVSSPYNYLANLYLCTFIMRLINAKTLVIREFVGRHIPQYAILSHTWGDDEVTLQDMQAGRASSKKGYGKIIQACEHAKFHCLKWVWVDTCCIDKSSSAELSEAINSMYDWYAKSTICYAYLADVKPVSQDQNNTGTATGNFDGVAEAMRKARWFTRGWTLQELIAPKIVIFFGQGWWHIGEKSAAGLGEIIADISGLPLDLIYGLKSLAQYSVAQKMSWAANRQCTRPEDMAYSLLGLFEVNIPLLYGEGVNAFTRLQEEILKETDDHSLLAWTVPKCSRRAWSLESVFAKSPADFARYKNIQGNIFDSGVPSTMTNRGLQIRLRVSKQQHSVESHLYHGNPACEVFYAFLNAGLVNSKDSSVKLVSIKLIRTPQLTNRHGQSINRYARLATPTLSHIHLKDDDTETVHALNSESEPVYIHKRLFEWEESRFGFGGIHLQNLPIARTLCPLLKTKPEDYDSTYGYNVRTFYYPGLSGTSQVAGGNMNLNPRQEMHWSALYGCIQFGPEIDNSLIGPHYTIFGVESLWSGYPPFCILLGFDEQGLHFGIRRGRFSLSDTSDSQVLDTLWSGLLSPLNPRTRQGDCWKMRGELARDTARVGDLEIEVRLIREDPNTRAGESAGIRLHFLIVTSFSKVDRDAGVEDEKKESASMDKLIDGIVKRGSGFMTILGRRSNQPSIQS
ncbi:HET-domain-containing protein [Whalleya microplaca]|nr:HET-domain-containing protein [Whalleya microplaca]